MIIDRIHGSRLMKLLLTAGIVFLSFWIWYFLFFTFYGADQHFLAQYLIYSLVTTGGVVLERLSRSVQPYIAPAHRASDRSIYLSIRQTIFAVIFVSLYVFATKDQLISRFFLGSFSGFLFFVLAWANHQLIPFLALRFFDGNRGLSVVLVGSPELVSRNLEWFRNRAEHGLRVIGYIGNGPDAPPIGDLPHLGAESDLDQTLERLRPALAVFLESPERSGELIQRKQLGDRLGIRIIHVWDFEASYGIIPIIHAEKDLYFLGFRTEPLESPVNRLVKRLIDISLALPVVLFVLPPLALVVKLVQQRQSPGPLFFVQERQGVGGLRFKMIKFRSMHWQDHDQTVQATRGDSRIYPMGAFLRKTSLDEFPQFINVLFGDMSVVGPRPHLPQHDHEFAKKFESYPVRAFVKPGITGLAQVRGFRGEI
ncbi:MAG: sugar transferase, partial [Puniceicoccaceae bacterium]